MEWDNCREERDEITLGKYRPEVALDASPSHENPQMRGGQK